MDEAIFRQLATKRDLEDFVTRDEFRHAQNDTYSRLDEMIVILKRLDQERVFTFEHIKRLEADVEKNRRDIDRIKDILKIS